LALGLGRLIGLRPTARLILAAALGGFYTLMVGAEPPYARACLCALILGAGIACERDPGPFQTLTLSAWLILLWRPLDLFSIGFQMTYLAAFGLVVAMPALPVAEQKPRRKRLIQALAAGTIVQLMLWPIFAAVFGRGSLVGPLANLGLVPYAALVMSAAFALWGAEPVGGCRVLAMLMKLLLEGFRWACFKLAALPFAAVDLRPMSGGDIIVYYLAVLALLLWPHRKTRFLLFACALAAACARPREDKLKVVFLSGKDARAAVVLWPDGRRWLIDAGLPGGALFRSLKALGVERLDKVIVAGPELGRWRGLEALSKLLPIAEEERSRTPFSFCYGEICFDFGLRQPRVRRGESEYSIIAPRLRQGAVAVVTDGKAAEITHAER
jgi:competence protein ComEC